MRLSFSNLDKDILVYNVSAETSAAKCSFVFTDQRYIPTCIIKYRSAVLSFLNFMRQISKVILQLIQLKIAPLLFFNVVVVAENGKLKTAVF